MREGEGRERNRRREEQEERENGQLEERDKPSLFHSCEHL